MKKILLVDDVKLLLEIQKKFLASSHVQILTANNGAEALETVRRELPDLIIMDKYMPQIDGLTCCRRIKEDPSLSHIPIIMATNAAKEDDRLEYLTAGCDDVLSKPIDCKLFLNAIKKYIPDIERRSTRVPLKIEMRMLHNGANYRMTTENLSFNGIFAVTDLAVALYDEVKFTFVLPERDVPMEVKGRIVWQGENRKGAGFGAEFIEVTGQGISMLRISELRAFVNSYSSARMLSAQAGSSP